ncbi:PaaI family thioesterase [Blastococcus sp. KM273128]|uniref:PaaI family thioesterase n=1 Tax=Blastococcus sp. KM273128 TaxID=2570314 RepID=UPI001F28DFDB|nr:PaaI family thioesterase [Blastococcus sp. KM273128]MCF6745322.1 PaaI family thioesterase [Blastococcus sp. KM273128]
MSTPPPDWLPDGISSPLDDKLGVRITDWNPDRLVATMPVAGNEQPFGLLHGGATCTLAETIGSMAAAVGAGPDNQVVGIELNVSYLRAATAGTVTAVCTPVRRGRTLSTFVIDVTDDEGRRTATARLTCMTLAARNRSGRDGG